MKAIFVHQSYVNIHESNIHYICKGKDEDEHLELLSKVKLLCEKYNDHYIEFDTYEEANLYFEQYEIDLYKEYTRLIINEGIPPIIPLNCRYVIVYKDENYYTMKLNEFVISDVRLATLEELDNLKVLKHDKMLNCTKVDNRQQNKCDLCNHFNTCQYDHCNNGMKRCSRCQEVRHSYRFNNGVCESCDYYS